MGDENQSSSATPKLIMNFKKIVFSLLMAVAFLAPNFANTNPVENKESSSAEVVESKEVKKETE